jgi:hypothetical protein
MTVRPLIMLFLFVNCNGQTKQPIDSKFKFFVSSLVNDTTHEVISYYVTQDSIIVKQAPGWDFSEKDKISYSSKFDNQERADITNIAATISDVSIKSFYNNPCIIRGTTHEFSFNWTNHIKRTALSNYYLDEVSPFVDFVNKKVPLQFKILYDKAKLQNDLRNCSTTQ